MEYSFDILGKNPERLATILAENCRKRRLDKGHRIHTLTAAALLQSDFCTQSIDYVNLLALTGYLTQDPAQASA